MKKHAKIISLTLTLFFALCFKGFSNSSGNSPVTDVKALSLENTRYSVKIAEDSKSLIFTSKQGGGTWVLKPDFVVLASPQDPKPVLMPGNVGSGILYNLVSWEAKNIPQKALLKKIEDNDDYVGDGFDQASLKAATDGRTTNIFYSAPATYVSADAISFEGDCIVLKFKDNKDFSLSAKITMPSGDAEPVFEYTFSPKADSYYSIGYIGAPAFALDDLDAIWQPFIWQEKRAPKSPIMTLAYHCSVPSTFVCKAAQTMGLVADASEIPFNPLPTDKNSRFGVALRTDDNKFKSMIFAPYLGGMNSKMKAGGSFTFKMRLFAQKGGITDAFEAAARRIYKVRDYRSNAIGSMNDTIANMIDYSMSQFAYFDEENKGCSYITDAVGTVKNVSALNPYEIAILNDNKEMYDKRAYLILEFLLSREKFLFAMDRNQKAQSPSSNMNGPATPVSEMATFYGLSNSASTVFMKYAKELFPKYRILNLQEVSGGKTWMDALDIYLNTNDEKYLSLAKKGADEYIAKNIDSPLKEFVDQSFFWTRFAPPFTDFYRLYKATNDKKYLEAAHHSARLYSMYIWMCPQIPDAKLVVNPDGKAPWYGYVKGKGYPQMDAPREEVEAWRLSEIGLTPESSGTMRSHRGIFMTNFAPWFLLIGSETDDKFLCDIARNAMVGRYLNFPGYHINTDRTTVYEKPDYPCKEYKQMSVNSFHYNHIMPMITLLYDYLITDICVRSKSAINFPTRYIEGYAYLQSNFYGDRAGEFFGRKNAYLWMPSKLLDISSVELNYIAARGQDGGFYLSFANQSRRTVGAKVKINKDLVKLDAGKEYEIKYYNSSDKSVAKTASLKDGEFEIDVPAMGLVSVAMDEIKIEPKFQQTLQNISKDSAWKRDYAELKVGNSRVMLINFGKSHLTVYAYLKDKEDVVKSATFTYTDMGVTKTLKDSTYPYEFTAKVSPKEQVLRFTIEVEKLDGTKESESSFLVRE